MSQPVYLEIHSDPSVDKSVHERVKPPSSPTSGVCVDNASFRFWMSVQGYFIRAKNLPRFWFAWAHWIDYQTYAFQLLVKNDFQGLVFPVSPSPFILISPEISHPAGSAMERRQTTVSVPSPVPSLQKVCALCREMMF